MDAEQVHFQGFSLQKNLGVHTSWQPFSSVAAFAAPGFLGRLGLLSLHREAILLVWRAGISTI